MGERIAEITTDIVFSLSTPAPQDILKVERKRLGATLVTPENLDSIADIYERRFAEICLEHNGWRLLHDVPINGGKVIDFGIEMEGEDGTVHSALFEITKSRKNNNSRVKREQTRAMRESGLPYEKFYAEDLSDSDALLKRVKEKLSSNGSHPSSSGLVEEER